MDYLLCIYNLLQERQVQKSNFEGISSSGITMQTWLWVNPFFIEKRFWKGNKDRRDFLSQRFHFVKRKRERAMKHFEILGWRAPILREDARTTRRSRHVFEREKKKIKECGPCKRIVLDTLKLSNRLFVISFYLPIKLFNEFTGMSDRTDNTSQKTNCHFRSIDSRKF